MSALHLPKAVQRWLLPRKQRLGFVVTQSQANPPLPQKESDWGFSSCYLCLHQCESALPRLWAIPPGNGRLSTLVLSWLQRNFTAWKGPHCLFLIYICIWHSDKTHNLGWGSRAHLLLKRNEWAIYIFFFSNATWMSLTMMPLFSCSCFWT